MPFGRLLSEVADIEEQLSSLPEAEALRIEQIRLDLPLEIRVQIDADGGLQVLGSPPTQRTETTILPVFHRLTLRVERDGTADW